MNDFTSLESWTCKWPIRNEYQIHSGLASCSEKDSRSSCLLHFHFVGLILSILSPGPQQPYAESIPCLLLILWMAAMVFLSESNCISDFLSYAPVLVILRHLITSYGFQSFRFQKQEKTEYSVGIVNMKGFISESQSFCIRTFFVTDVQKYGLDIRLRNL